MTHGMRDYLSVPLKGTRDIYLPSGRRVRMKLKLLQKNMLTFVYLQVQKLTLAIEVLKEAGASPAPPPRARRPSACCCSRPRHGSPGSGTGRRASSTRTVTCAGERAPDVHRSL